MKAGEQNVLNEALQQNICDSAGGDGILDKATFRVVDNPSYHITAFSLHTGGKEVDLLAVNPISAEKYHIEVRVAIGKGFRLRLIDTQTKSGRKHRRGLDTLNEIKFSHPTVVNAVREIFGSSEYRKVLVVWDVEDGSVIEQAKSLYKIEVWKMSDIISRLTQEVKTKPYRNDVLRTIQLISKRGLC